MVTKELEIQPSVLILYESPLAVTAVLQYYSFVSSAVVLFRPAHMNVKFEENQVALADADASVYNMEKFFDEKQ